MSATVIVRFHARAGQGDALAAWLTENQRSLPSFAGFEHITLLRDASDPDRLVEIERWARAEDHRAMVAAVAERGGWDSLEVLLESEPQTSYLDEVASRSR